MLESSLPRVGNNCGVGSVSKIQTLAQKCKSCAVLDELCELDPVLLRSFDMLVESRCMFLLKIKTGSLGDSILLTASILFSEFLLVYG